MSDSELSDHHDDPYALYRQPTTTDSNAFWYCSQATWNSWIECLDSTDKRKKKTARNNLNKFSAAALIMESAEGKVAPNPCERCQNAGHVCMVYANKEDLACAYCKRLGKAGCAANKAGGADTGDAAGGESGAVGGESGASASESDRLTALEVENAALKGEIATMTGRLERLEYIADRQEKINQAIAEESMNKGKDIHVLWDKIFPDQQQHESEQQPEQQQQQE